jgi:glycosyltransferase involved in cell wall biosynthesis
MKRVLYIQYTNPGGYPPLEHSSKILADAGWEVLFLGTGASGADSLDFPPHPRITVRRLPFEKPGWRQKLQYVRFCFQVLATAFTWRPQWVYASDPFSCPPALAMTFLPWLKVLYHEHDSPADKPGDGFFALILSARRALARRAEMCVLPNARRLEWFEAQLGPLRRKACVWNCPRRAEAANAAHVSDPAVCTVVYHGTIVPARLPPSVIEALTLLPDSIKLRITGYETVGAKGYVRELAALADSFGVGHRLEFRGTLPYRAQLLEGNRDADIGLAMMPMRSVDLNLLGMTGASNKAFDYMAYGLALVVSDLPDWRAMFADQGYGLTCNPEDPRSLANAIGWLAANPAERRRMGESGRQRILAAWNYEAMFEPVFDLMSGTPSVRPQVSVETCDRGLIER